MFSPHFLPLWSGESGEVERETGFRRSESGQNAGENRNSVPLPESIREFRNRDLAIFQVERQIPLRRRQTGMA